MTREDRVLKTVVGLISRYPSLETCRDDILRAFDIMRGSFEEGGKLLICGSGGSASDALHITGELMKAFMTKRTISADVEMELNAIDEEDGAYLSSHLEGALPAIALVENSALATALQNDIAGDIAYAQQVLGLGNRGDVLLAISTSGNSKSGAYAIEVAKAKGLYTIGLTGSKGGRFKKLCDTVIRVPETETYKVQELHLPVYHALCRMLEVYFFGE